MKYERVLRRALSVYFLMVSHTFEYDEYWPPRIIGFFDQASPYCIMESFMRNLALVNHEMRSTEMIERARIIAFMLPFPLRIP